MNLTLSLLDVIAGYLALGMLVAVPFVLFGVARVDAGVRGAQPLLRLLLIPGAALLWPWIVRRWWLAARRAG